MSPAPDATATRRLLRKTERELGRLPSDSPFRPYVAARAAMWADRLATLTQEHRS